MFKYLDTLSKKILFILTIVGITSIIIFSVFFNITHKDAVLEDARENSKNQMNRAVEMFMVSTKKFHDQFNKVSGDSDKKAVLDKWNETIVAVDQAVINDFGNEQVRVRLIGDESLVGYKPLGEQKDIGIKHPFETNAINAFKAGEEYYEEIEGQEMLKTSIPLFSDAHPGCGECHFAVVEGISVDFNRKVLLGTLNSYVPLQKEFSKAGSELNFMIITFVLIISLILLSIYFFMQRVVKKPVDKVLFMAQEIQKGHVKVRTNVKSNDELGRMASALDQFIQQVDESIVGTLKRIAKGDTNFQVPNYDEKDEIAPELNKLVNVISDLVKETNLLTEAAVNGDLKKRGNTEKFEGEFKKLVEGINNTLDVATSPIMEGSKVLQEMAQGDLTARIEALYHGDHQIIKNSINDLGESLSKLISDVSEAAHATASSSAQISASTEEMAAGSQEQSAQTSEVATAIEQMTKTILETTQNAAGAAENAKRAGDIASEGGKVVESTVKGMEKIAQVVSEAAERVKQLGNNSNQIGEIIQVIDDIADQTNLLALNAAIEAARAGEQGRGFAVVADEVRKLAERTTKATKEIAGMIKQIQKDTGDAVKKMDEGTIEVQKGRELSNKAGGSLQEIIKATIKVVDDVTQVATASEEQSTAAEQISKNIESMNNVTHESASGIQQVAAAAEDLNRLTENLQNLLSNFKIERNASESNYRVRENGKLVGA